MEFPTLLDKKLEWERGMSVLTLYSPRKAPCVSRVICNFAMPPGIAYKYPEEQL